MSNKNAAEPTISSPKPQPLEKEILPAPPVNTDAIERVAVLGYN